MTGYFEYYTFDNEKFFTMILKPKEDGVFPAVVIRTPYVRDKKEMSEEEILKDFVKENSALADAGYAVVFQHCRGQGKSTGEFIPYIHEREDGLYLREWIRKQDFYNGELFLFGGSYTASLHYSTAPFEEDIKGAVFNVQDSERYRLWYRNGQMRRGHANWHFELYKDKKNLNKIHTMDSFSELPLKNLSERVLGERADDFEEMLDAEKFTHPFWQTRFGGAEARDAVKSADIPILLTTGYNDFYVGGVFRMWNEMDKSTREKSALIVSPYNHGDTYDENNGLKFHDGSIKEHFGEDYHVKWFDSIRKKTEPPVEKNKVAYYRAFENVWDYDFYKGDTEDIKIPLGSGEAEMPYDPANPPAFEPEGIFQSPPCERRDIVSIYTKPFEKDTFIKGRMRAKLLVSTDAEDTSFYIMISIKTPEGDYALRHDITSLHYQNGDYKNGEKAELDFLFDEYAFLIKKGWSLRIDIAPTDKNTYVCHTNKKGQYSLINSYNKAENKIYLGDSYILLPEEK